MRSRLTLSLGCAPSARRSTSLETLDKSTKLTIIIVSMALRESFSLVYAPLFKAHLKGIEAKYYSLIRNEIETQLSFEPETETHNRKPLKRPIIVEATWELRLGPWNRFRVFYKIIRESAQVQVLAIGEKKGNKLFIGGKEFEP